MHAMVQYAEIGQLCSILSNVFPPSRFFKLTLRFDRFFLQLIPCFMGHPVCTYQHWKKQYSLSCEHFPQLTQKQQQKF
jgi:hypothetical protein